jgi:drug/metabolite transporter (DMT)-like permease
MWLFVTPVLGYILAVLLLREKVTPYAIVGTLMVIAGVSIARRIKKIEKDLEVSTK